MDRSTDTVDAGTWTGSSARKHEAMLAAAGTVFQRHGYLKANLDEVAEIAAVSKRTVYKHFRDKDTLFAEAMLAVLEPRRRAAQSVLAKLADTDDVHTELRTMARTLIAVVVTTETIRFRRIVVTEAERFPQLARHFLDQSVGQHIRGVAEHLAKLTRRGVLHCPDPHLAAQHLNWLILGTAVNESMFATEVPFTPAQLRHLADEGVATFLRAYRAP